MTRRLTELEEWQQAASVEAGLRREFLARAERAEAEIERLLGDNASMDKSLGRMRELADRQEADLLRLRAALKRATDYIGIDDPATAHDIEASVNEQSTPSPYTGGHAKDCAYHQDQYSWECTCGVTERERIAKSDR